MSTQPKKVCPRCGKNLSLRNGSRGSFWGCTGYPKCRHTENYVSNPDGPTIGFFAFNKEIVRELRSKLAAGTNFKNFKPSLYQQAAGDFIKNGIGNALIDAVAGSGKSTTLLWLMSLLNGSPEINTLHSHGFAALRKAMPWLNSGDSVIDEWKKDGIAKELLPDDETVGIDNKYARSILIQLTALIQNTLTDCNDANAVSDLIDRFGIDMNGSTDKVLSNLPRMIQLCAERTKVVDYEDMIWLPVYLNLPIQQYDFVFCDEAQDLNAVQIELVLRTVKKTGRIICVGDPYQSIYGFRGADLDAIPNIIKATNATVLPLSITYRCPVSHVALAKNLVSHLETGPNALDGEIRYNMPMHKAITEMRPQAGDMVLCRLNAPLVKVCYALIRSGKKAVIRGRDIGKGLLTLVDKMKAANIPELSRKLEDYRHNELAKLYAKNARESTIASLNDRINTLQELTDGIYDLSELRLRISNIFNDKGDNVGVICSSVHRAKGLEADSIYILNPELLPFPKATRQWEIQQEMNILYVALTRSKRLLTFVDGYPTVAVNKSSVELIEQELVN